jgi:predicted nucleic acid-binding protein
LTIYADTSFLVSLYTPDANSEPAAQLMQRTKPPVLFTPLGEAELTNAFYLRIFRKELNLSEVKRAFAMFREDLATGVIALKPLPGNAFQRAIQISRGSTARLGTRTLDILHVASALALSADQLYTFDNAQRRLARAEGLASS